MSEWFYIGLALGVTWVSLAVYTVRTALRARAAESGLRELAGGEEP